VCVLRKRLQPFQSARNPDHARAQAAWLCCERVPAADRGVQRHGEHVARIIADSTDPRSTGGHQRHMVRP
jgi:hypothetical protein